MLRVHAHECADVRLALRHEFKPIVSKSYLVDGKDTKQSARSCFCYRYKRTAEIRTGCQTSLATGKKLRRRLLETFDNSNKPWPSSRREISLSKKRSLATRFIAIIPVRSMRGTEAWRLWIQAPVKIEIAESTHSAIGRAG